MQLQGSWLAEAQEIQQELQGADDKRKARFAKMKASYDTLLEERDATILAAASPTNKATMMDVSCDYSLCLPFCMLCYLHSSAAAQLRSIAFDSPDHTCCCLILFLAYTVKSDVWRGNELQRF